NYATTFTENGGAVAVADADIAISDVDNTNLVSATITLTNAQASDVLAVAGVLPGGILSSIVGNVVTLSGSATLAQYQAAIQQVTFSNTSDNPNTTPRTITVVVNDGAAASNTATTTVTVVAVNDPPVNTEPGLQTVNEDTNLAISGLSVNDLDGNLATTQLTVANGTLNITLSGGASISAGLNGSASLTISGTQADINATLTSLIYRGVADYNGPDTLTVLSTDAAGLTDTDVVNITVNPVNDAPVNTVPGAQAVNEDTALAIAGVSVIDVDGNLATTQLTVTNGNVTVNLAGGATISSGLNGSGTLTLSGTQAQINAALATISYQGNLNYNGPATLTVLSTDAAGVPLSDTDVVNITVNPVNDPPVNTVPGLQTVNEDTNLAISGLSVNDLDGNLATTQLTVANGTLNITLSGGASISAGLNGSASLTISGTQADINATLTSLIYRGVADYNGPDTLTVLSTDAAGLTDTDVVNITVNPVNDPPVLDLDANNSTGAAGANYTGAYTEGGAAVAIADVDSSVTDLDNANVVSAVITLTNAVAGDVLSVLGVLPAGIVANLVGNVLTLSGSATLASYETAIEQVRFANSGDNPGNTARVINVVVNDGTGNSNTAVATISVTPLNDAPTLDLDGNDSSGAAGNNYATTFTEGGAAVSVGDADVAIVDPDNTNLVSATITLTNAQAADVLAVAGVLPGGILSSIVGNVVTLTGSATLAQYQAAIAQVTFSNTSDNPNTTPRTITVVVNDGAANSAAATTTVTVVPVNDP
ncbi:tandem-95 repeat protein, partial [Caenimonas sedimenti]